MHKAINAAFGLFAIGSVCAGVSMAQGIPTLLPPGLANIKMVQAGPERAGDRAMSCEQITAEIGQIMQKRNVNQATSSAKAKICSSRQVLDRQVNEKVQLQQAQTPALAAASLAPGPAANAMISQVGADTVALEQRQQPARQQAAADMMSGMGSMVEVFNDPRLMRLGMLMQERQCTMSAPEPPPDDPVDPCAGTGTGENQALPAGPPDPFAKRASPTPATAAPGGADPFARR